MITYICARGVKLLFCNRHQNDSLVEDVELLHQHENIAADMRGEGCHIDKDNKHDHEHIEGAVDEGVRNLHVKSAEEQIEEKGEQSERAMYNKIRVESSIEEYCKP